MSEQNWQHELILERELAAKASVCINRVIAKAISNGCPDVQAVIADLKRLGSEGEYNPNDSALQKYGEQLYETFKYAVQEKIDLQILNLIAELELYEKQAGKR